MTAPIPTQDPERFCACGHHQDEHAHPGEAGTPCAATQPDRCSCRGFRRGTRSLADRDATEVRA